MTFEKKYKNLPTGGLSDHVYLCAKDKYPCAICGALTNFIHVDYIAPVCSDECAAELEKLYQEIHGDGEQ